MQQQISHLTTLLHMAERTTSIISNNAILPILDLGMHPFADTFIPKQRLGDSELILPLEVMLSPDDGAIQCRYTTNGINRYNDYDYSYTSANSVVSRTHWKHYAMSMIHKFKLNSDAAILEIGSNDGFLCQQFQAYGRRNVTGVDASRHMADIAKNVGVPTICTVFDQSSVSLFDKQFDLIVANNVLNHSDNPVSFCAGVQQLLTPGGVFVFELPYWKNTVASGMADQVYHEHVTYFTVTFARKLMNTVGLVLVGYDEVDYHGGSIRCYVQHAGVTEPDSVYLASEQESAAGLFDVETYRELSETMLLRKHRLMNELYRIKERDGHIVAVGAAAKGNTLLNYHGLNKQIIDYVTDASAEKIGKYTPLSRIPITTDAIIRDMKNVHILTLAWNIGDRLKTILYNINPNISFIETI